MCTISGMTFRAPPCIYDHSFLQNVTVIRSLFHLHSTLRIQKLLATENSKLSPVQANTKRNPTIIHPSPVIINLRYYD